LKRLNLFKDELVTLSAQVVGDAEEFGFLNDCPVTTIILQVQVSGVDVTPSVIDCA
jgi:hypothetical protein